MPVLLSLISDHLQHVEFHYKYWPNHRIIDGVVGGFARAVLSSFFIAAILLWEKDEVGFVLFYSVIYNSVGPP